jgi:ATP-dependent helicase STH1/SNF2
MINNAKTYNQEGSWVYVDAVLLMETFEERYNTLAKHSGLPGSVDEGEKEENGEEDQEEEDSKESIAVAPVSRPKIKISMKGRNSKAASNGKKADDMSEDDD